jgi:hypothetical protein
VDERQHGPATDEARPETAVLTWVMTEVWFGVGASSTALACNRLETSWFAVGEVPM